MAFDPTSVGTDGGEPLSPERVASLLSAAEHHVIAELDGLGDELAGWRPAPGEWSANECVGHLIEADRRGFGGRIERIRATDGVVEEGWDQLAVAASRRDWERPVAAVIEEFRAGREAGIATVRSLRRDELARHAVHARVGTVTISDLLQEWVFHDRNHIRQLLANAQARVWPTMGGTRGFTDPNA
ncbi:MAG TPA: DinB family protein [Candidatus Limnocylindrales bacterium]|nr:DinB family protein [Candidatus Limnocylindrales bacterium]